MLPKERFKNGLTCDSAGEIKDRVGESSGNCHWLRHPLVTDSLEDFYDVGRVQGLLGRKNVMTMMMYRHVFERWGSLQAG